MDLPTIYTIEEAAQLFRASEQAVLEEIEAGRLQAFKVGKDWRTTDRAIVDFIARGGSRPEIIVPLAQQEFLVSGLQRTEAFQYTWPSGDVEEYLEAYEGSIEVDKEQVAVKIGIGERHAAGRMRKRVTVFLKGRPTVEFAGVDDFDESHLVTGVVTLPSKKRLMPRQRVPNDYLSFRLVRYNTVVRGPRATSAMAVLTRVDDLMTMVSHAIIQARYRGQL